MFSGIIEKVGTIKNIIILNNRQFMEIGTDSFLKGVTIGESIAVNGVCLTVLKVKNSNFISEISFETKSKTTFKYAKIGDKVNLEKAIKPDNTFSGHIVTGHIDTTGQILHKKKILENIVYTLRIPKEYEKYIVEKGSIAIDGISLTVNKIKNNLLSFCVLPYTENNTNLKYKKPGDLVNIETDIISKHVEKIIKHTESNTNISFEKLRKYGF